MLAQNTVPKIGQNMGEDNEFTLFLHMLNILPKYAKYINEIIAYRELFKHSIDAILMQHRDNSTEEQIYSIETASKQAVPSLVTIDKKHTFNPSADFSNAIKIMRNYLIFKKQQELLKKLTIYGKESFIKASTISTVFGEMNTLLSGNMMLPEQLDKLGELQTYIHSEILPIILVKDGKTPELIDLDNSLKLFILQNEAKLSLPFLALIKIEMPEMSLECKKLIESKELEIVNKQLSQFNIPKPFGYTMSDEDKKIFTVFFNESLKQSGVSQLTLLTKLDEENEKYQKILKDRPKEALQLLQIEAMLLISTEDNNVNNFIKLFALENTMNRLSTMQKILLTGRDGYITYYNKLAKQGNVKISGYFSARASYQLQDKKGISK